MAYVPLDRTPNVDLPHEIDGTPPHLAILVIASSALGIILVTLWYFLS